MPSGSALAEAYVRVRADMSQVGPDVLRGTQSAVNAAATGTGQRLKDAVAGPLRAGLDAGVKQAGPAGQAAGNQFRAGLASRLRDTATDAAAAGREHGRRFSEAQTVSVREGGVKLSETIHEGFTASLAGLTAGLAGLGAVEVFKHFIEGANDARKATALTEQVIKTTGGAAHVTAGDVDELARSISDKTGIDDDAVHSSENLLLTFTNVRNEVGRGNDIFAQATGLVQDMSVALGQDAKSSAIQLGKALQDPVTGATALRRVGVALDDQQKAQIKTFVASGRTLEAQKVILAEVGKEFGGAAEAASTPLQKLTVHVENLGKQFAGRLLPAVDKTATVMSDDVLPAVEGVARFLGSIPAPVYAAVGAFAALRGGMIAAAAASAAFSAVGGVTGIVGGLRLSLAGVVGLLGSPWTVAFVGAAAVAAAWVKRQQDARAAVDALTDSLDKQTGAVTNQTRAQVVQQLQQQGALVQARQLGVSLSDITDATLGNADALARVNDALKVYFPNGQQAQVTAHGQSKAFLDNERAAVALGQAIGGQTRTVRDSVQAWKDRQAANQDANDALAKTPPRLTAAALAERLHAEQVRAATLTQRAETSALDKFLTALDAQLNRFLGLRGAQRDYRAALDDVTKALHANGTSMDVDTAKGRANSAALDAVAASGGKVLDQMLANHARGPVFRAEWERQRAKLLDVARQFGLNKDAARRYVDDALGKVPPSVSTSVSTPGLPTAKKAIHDLGVQIQALKGKNLEVVIDSRGNAILHETGRLGHAATGGYITGPGGPREDRAGIYALSNGEFVVNAAATSRHRPLLEHINARGMADGGLVDRDVHVNTRASMPRHLTADILARIDALAVLGAGGGPGGAPGAAGGAARWAGVILSALRMLGQSAAWLGTVESRMNRESGGNPYAINLWDSNAQHGDPSRGLMQTIMSTFLAYAGALRGRGIYDPLANTYAGLNYALHRYGSLAALNRPGGYAGGTANAAPGWRWVGEGGRELVQFSGGEHVKSAGASRAADMGGPVRLHPESVAQIGAALAAALTRQPVVLDGHTITGYVDRAMGRASLSVRG